MAQEARIKLTSTNLLTLENVCSEIKDIGEKKWHQIKRPSSTAYKKNASCNPKIPLWARDKHMGQV
jgi:small subunit ribosomal protein S10